MKRFEQILVTVAVLAIVLKILHLPLSGFLLIVSLSLLSMIYFFLGWLLFPTPTQKDQKVPLSITVGLTLNILLMGILFKLQVWPLAGFYLLLGLFMGAAFLVTIYLLRRSKPELRAYWDGLMRRLLIASVVAACLYPISGRALLHFYYRDQPRRAELLDSLHYVQDQATLDRLTRELDEMERRSYEQQ